MEWRVQCARFCQQQALVRSPWQQLYQLSSTRGCVSSNDIRPTNFPSKQPPIRRNSFLLVSLHNGSELKLLRTSMLHHRSKSNNYPRAGTQNLPGLLMQLMIYKMLSKEPWRERLPQLIIRRNGEQLIRRSFGRYRGQSTCTRCSCRSSKSGTESPSIVRPSRRNFCSAKSPVRTSMQ